MNINPLQIILEWKNKESKEHGKNASRIIARGREEYKKDPYGANDPYGAKRRWKLHKAAEEIKQGQESVGKRRETDADRSEHYREAWETARKRISPNRY